MTIDNDDLLNSIRESLDRVKYISPEDIPNIDLYMDQVTTFMDSRLQSSARYPGKDKILTKTMINNYAKNDLLPPPVKKKYSREHVMLLGFIYYYRLEQFDMLGEYDVFQFDRSLGNNILDKELFKAFIIGNEYVRFYGITEQ